MRLDLALAALTSVAVLTGAAITGDFSHGGTVPLATWLGVLLLARRRWPVLVLAGSVVVLCGFGGTDLGTPGWVWPATVAYVTVVLAGQYRWALGLGVVNIAAMTPFVPSQAWLGVEALWLALAMVGAYAYTERSRHRVTEERLAIARELHDVVAHTLAVVGIHLNVAVDTLDEDPGQAREALRLAQSVRGQAMADLRSLIGTLRAEPHPDDAPDLAELVTRTSATGLPVRLAGDLAGLPTPVALAAYRVVQEGLTNVLKHAGASAATVTVTRETAAVTVSVVDDGSGLPTAPGGHGIAGMRERVEALGGILRAGPNGYGFELTARLPL
ncbi:sensor histidine kinase [Actinophytocola sp.]|uniref:sensor histidine kinase n=1 Tax=Actinophytocola sp. TaxID=1872138 RepID=UPI002ED3E8A3